ncbi:MAG: bifunctional pyr operon transcriptional regulator/uracil phosphoribosyltransferase PyrR [Gammaproteobacteria bacterium]
MTMPEVEPLLAAMTATLQQRIAALPKAPVMVGIHSGGAWIAERLHQALQLEQPLGLLDISFYRDDFEGKGLHPSVKPSVLPFAIDDQHVILVDDVVMSGRTIRAALNELFDYGRPASVLLAALVDLPQRQLPIQPDVAGIRMDLQPGQRVKLAGPAPLTLTLVDR